MKRKRKQGRGKEKKGKVGGSVLFYFPPRLFGSLTTTVNMATSVQLWVKQDCLSHCLYISSKSTCN